MTERALYLVRHGATAANQEGRYIGCSEHPLSPEGEAQAARLAAFFRAEPPAAIRSSDLGRALQTARAIGAATGLPVQPDPRLRELHFGQWDGLTYTEIEALAPAPLRAWLEDPEHRAPPGGESLASLRSRALAALAESPDRTVLVTHGGVVRALLAHLTGRPLWDFRPPPGSLTRIRLAGDQLRGAPVTTEL
ncbi:MAG: histidine phosphatase family protein [Bacillota bacterium]